MSKLIEPRVLKGFRDSLPYGPQGEKRRRRIIERLGQLFELGGFDPIDTPALELSEILLGKAGGETEKQIYRFQDNGGREVALRFDLTVPFSRFVVQHSALLNLPFKRYHIAKVWRGENAQRGRYREFFQCDFDIVGDQSILADLCILQMAHRAFSQLQQDFPALGPLRIHINHRGLLAAFWNTCGTTAAQRVSALRIIDKWHKIGAEAVQQKLEELLGSETTETLIPFLSWRPQTNSASDIDFESELQRLRLLLGELVQNKWGSRLPPEADKALNELQHIAQFAIQNDMPLHFDPSIARGLDYYTGMVFESFLQNLPSLGSVCSGGRYDQLTQLYREAPMPGVGASIGLDRLLAGLAELEKQGPQQTEAMADRSGLLLSLDPDWKSSSTDETIRAQLACLQISNQLQAAGQACDLVPRSKKMSSLFQRAEVKSCRYLLLLKADFSWQLRDLQNLESRALPDTGGVLRALL